MALGLVLASLLGPERAWAGNDDGVLLGNAALLSGGALTATVSDGSATWFNPAGLAQVVRDSVDVSGNAYQLGIGSTPTVLESASGARVGGDFIDFVTLPSALTLARRVDSTVVLALGVFVPSSRSHSERFRLHDVLSAGSADWDFSIRDDRQTYAASGCVGFTLAPNLRFGVGLFGTYEHTSSSGSLFGTIDDATGATLLGFAVSGSSSLESVTLGLTAGLQWTPLPGLHFGVAVQSPRFSIGSRYSEGTSALLATPGHIVAMPEATGSLQPAFEISSPTRVRFGVGLTLGPALLSFDGDVQHELSNPAVGVDRGTTGGVRVGARVRIDESFTIGGGLFTDFNGDRGAYDYGRARMQFLGASLGLEVRTRHVLGSGESAGSIEFVQTYGLRYAFGQGRIGALHFDVEGASPFEVVGRPTSVHELALHVGNGLYF